MFMQPQPAPWHLAEVAVCCGAALGFVAITLFTDWRAITSPHVLGCRCRWLDGWMGGWMQWPGTLKVERRQTEGTRFPADGSRGRSSAPVAMSLFFPCVPAMQCL